MDELYTPKSLENFDYDKDLGNPGEAPFTRGIYPNMYKGKPFTMRQLTGFGSPEDTNKRIKYMLQNGATGLSILFDFPTIQMYDSDDPLSEGHVGFSGVCVDTIEDMYVLFKDIDLEKISISIVTHYPSNTALLFSMFIAMVEEMNIPLKNLRGSVQNDITMEDVVRCGFEFLHPKNVFRIQCDNMEYIMNNIPKWNPITLNGYNLRECGTDAITEMAVALANGIETITEMIKRGFPADLVAKRIAFFWSIGNNFFEEVARLRAIRRIWYRILKTRFGVTDKNSLLLRCHVQTSGISLTSQEPLNNIARASFQALAAIFGGVQSLHVDSYDEAYSVPTEESALLSLRTQQIIQEETGVTNVVDPLGGSYFIESLTNDIEERILDELTGIESSGGYIKLIESKNLHRKIEEYAWKQTHDIEKGVIPVVGVNKYNRGVKTPISIFKYPEGVEEKQKNILKELKLKRDNNKAKSSLEKLEWACKNNGNIMVYCIECVKARCTEGEMFKVFKRSFGLWTP